MTLEQRLTAPGPKRILALDGGGIRGALTLGFLERIEDILRKQHGRDVRLSEYFDLIGGTSTGAIIAAALATGKTAKEVKDLYLQLGGRVFGRKEWKKWVSFFKVEPLNEELQKVFGKEKLGSDFLKTGLCVVTKRADTRSTWPLINHPRGRYYPKNKHILLWKAVRASTAAPTYFIPEDFDVGEGERGAFVDGGVSMANNPALLLFFVATLKGFPFHWQTGERNLLLVSVGTGVWQSGTTVADVLDDKLWNWAGEIPGMLMDDANWQNQLILQYLSKSPTRYTIDREIGNLVDDLLTPEPVLTYLRYNAWIEEKELNDLELPILAARAKSLREMSAAENRFDLARIGEAAAAAFVKPDHFPEAFKIGAAARGDAAVAAADLPATGKREESVRPLGGSGDDAPRTVA